MKNSYFFYDNLSLKPVLAMVIGSYIISYQNVVGNYNQDNGTMSKSLIISYQNVVGNYNDLYDLNKQFFIISYQNVVGNYNLYFIALC